MWRNHLMIAVRRLIASPGYTAITIGGLVLGLAGCLSILNYIRYERNYDGWVPSGEHVFQVQSTIHPPNLPTVHTQTSSFSIYDRLAPAFPQVDAVTSISLGKTVTERDGTPAFIEAATVDPSFFRVFPIAFRHGAAATALADANAVVLTESEAVRWFGTADVLGRSLTLGAGDGRRDYRVSGVLADLPRNTNLRLGLIFRRDVDTLSPDQRTWGNFDQIHYVRLKPGADVGAVNAGLPAWERRVIPTIDIGGRPATMSDAFDFALVPLAEVHLGVAQDGALTPGGDPRALATFGVVALLTLGMAIINFVNLSTARATQRAREVALRKILGAGRGQLIAQFMGESLLLVGVATVLALAVVELAAPSIGALLGAPMPVAYFGEGGMLMPALVLLVVTGGMGGLYPAVLLSRFRPADVLRASMAGTDTAGGGRLRAALVVAQFAIAIGLVASTAVIWSQTRFVERVDPGYRRDGLIQIANGWRFTQGSEYDAARPLMLAIPGVTAVARTQLGLGENEASIRLARLPGAPTYLSMGFYGVDADFLRTLGAELRGGRMLGDRFAADRLADETPDVLTRRGLNLVVNETAARRIAPGGSAVGQAIELEAGGGTMMPATIVGVVEDTRYRSAREAIEPMIYAYQPGATGQVLVRYAGARPDAVMAGLERVWRRFEPEIPFEARFVDDIVRELYEAERTRTILFAGFSALAVLIACLGLYGLAAFATERRTKEIGIRKVLGATVADIVRLLAWQFARPVVLANLLAWPVAWWAMREWLNGFDTRIALTPTPFALAGFLALVIALATVAGHTLRVAHANPIHALRYE